eukprot:Partr_v1_DN27445_c4_g1_i1_m71981 putative Lysophosphatidylcholine acyltransferase 3
MFGWVFAFGYRMKFVDSQRGARVKSSDQVWLQHVILTLFGLAISWFNFGADTRHFVFAIAGSWLILRVGGPTFNAAAGVFAWAFGYLLWGYFVYNSIDDRYTINWTTPYCVMCLRLIGFGMDYYDGSLSKSKDSLENPLRNNWANVLIKKLPNLLETMSYCFFFGGFLVGPQFPYAVYENFMTLRAFQDGKDKRVKVPSYTSYAYTIFLMGLAYIIATQLGNAYFPTSFVLTKEYASYSLLGKFVYATIAGRIVLTKYIGMWLFNEVSCVISGISFRGYDQNNNPEWNGLTNAYPAVFERLQCLNDVVRSFNMNTNLWCKNYIFKRLKCLNSKAASGMGTLFFLAIWHGYAPAYFVCFATEFLDMEVEKRFSIWFAPLWNWLYAPSKSQMDKGAQMFVKLVCHIVALSTLSNATIAFDLLEWGKVMTFLGSLYYY